MVLSRSDDAVIDTRMTGTLNNPNATVLNNAIIPSSGNVSAAATINIDPNNSDIVRWVTLDELRSKVGCQGAPLKIVNNELPFGSAAAAYANVTINADGGVQFAAPDRYRWCIQTAALGIAPAGL